ncbi:hypothetical protein CEXT_150901 [Caerostris extrusa]|uniref:Uncharacterized protein n=1 Tax=Caerostris extrusa TaxID=172846 RepID=A0AAV4PE25_CAEEX|nr:hypothetical protein CEXT_150901 [Caerostris extrusa]
MKEEQFGVIRFLAAEGVGVYERMMNLGASPTNRNQMKKTKMETSQLHTNTGGVLRCFILMKKVNKPGRLHPAAAE